MGVKKVNCKIQIMYIATFFTKEDWIFLGNVMFPDLEICSLWCHNEVEGCAIVMEGGART